MIGLAEDSWAKPGGMDDRIEVYGTTGVSFADLFRGNAAQTYSEKGYGYAAEKAGSTQGWTYTIFEEVFNQGYPHELQHFIECVREDKTPLVTGEDGRAVLEIIYAAYASARSGAKVPLPFHPKVEKADRFVEGVGTWARTAIVGSSGASPGFRDVSAGHVVTLHVGGAERALRRGRSAHGQSGRGRQQYRFTAAKPRSGKVWHGQVRLAQHDDAGDAAGIGELMPDRLGHRLEAAGPAMSRVEQRLQRVERTPEPTGRTRAHPRSTRSPVPRTVVYFGRPEA